MTTLIYWFRNDLRLHDNPALCSAMAQADHLLPVFCMGSASAVHNGDPRWGVMQPSPHRQRVLADTLMDLDAQLRQLGSALTVLYGDPADMLPKLSQALGASAVHCEQIAATHEEDEVQAVREAGCHVVSRWQSGLFDLDTLPFAVADLPGVFTAFRQAITLARCTPVAPLARPSRFSPLPPQSHGYATVNLGRHLASLPPVTPDPRASVPYWLPEFAGGERAALAHVDSYLGSDRVAQYKATRNGLTGVAFSSKCSAWLASGALSVRQLASAVAQHEATAGPTEGSQWLLFELLWREHFRLLHLQHGAKMFRYRGLRDKAAPIHHDPALFSRWCLGRTKEPLVNAAMHELLATGYLSNRMRQVVASHLVHDLGCDWRAGAAWFEAQLIDYDVTTNQGNWLYIAGMGSDPRGGRRFNLDKQAQDHDPHQDYQRLWETV